MSAQLQLSRVCCCTLLKYMLQHVPCMHACRCNSIASKQKLNLGPLVLASQACHIGSAKVVSQQVTSVCKSGHYGVSTHRVHVVRQSGTMHEKHHHSALAISSWVVSCRSPTCIEAVGNVTTRTNAGDVGTFAGALGVGIAVISTDRAGASVPIRGLVAAEAPGPQTVSIPARRTGVCIHTNTPCCSTLKSSRNKLCTMTISACHTRGA
jgi:hypothetical protein